MEILIGIFLAIGVGISTSWIGMDKDRALYPVMMIVIAAYYVLFACIDASSQTLLVEIGIAVLFQAVAVYAFKSNLWFAVVALAAHGVWDIFHGHFIDNPGMPDWWPGFCSAYDIAAAIYLSGLLWRQGNRMRVGKP